MLEKKYRLTKRKQFNYIYRKGKSSGGQCVTLVYCFARLRNVKVGFSASKKLGNSVVRHKALRRLRAVLRPLVSDLAPNNNYIFIAKEGIITASHDALRADVIAVLKKARLILQGGAL